MALPPLTLEQWNGYCLRVVNILFALVGILMSLSVIFSCQFFSVPVDPESLSSVVGGNNVDSSYEVSVGLFRHTLTKDDYSLDSASECRMYDDSFLLDPDSAFYDSSLAAAQIGALLAPVLALLGCIFCFLHVFCRIFYVVGFWLTSGSWFVATILQAMSFLAFQHEKFCNGGEFFKNGCEMDTGARVSIVAVLLYVSAFMTLFCIPRPKKQSAAGHHREQNKTAVSRSSPDLEHGGGGGGEEEGFMHPATVPEEMEDTDLEISFEVEDTLPDEKTTTPPSDDSSTQQYILGSPIVWTEQNTPNDQEATPSGTTSSSSQSEGNNKADVTDTNETTAVEASSISPQASEEPKAEPTKKITGNNWMGAVTSFFFKRRNDEEKTSEEGKKSPNEVNTIAAVNDIFGFVDVSIIDEVESIDEEFPNSMSAIEPQLIESSDGESELNTEEAAEIAVDVPAADEVIKGEKEAETDAEQIMTTTEAVIEAENGTDVEANSEAEANASGRIDTDQAPETEIDEAGATSGIEQGQDAEDIALAIQAKVWTNKDGSSSLLSRSPSRSIAYTGPVDLDDSIDDSTSKSSVVSSTESEQEAAQMQSSLSDNASQYAVDTKEVRDVPVDPSKTDDSSEAEGAANSSPQTAGEQSGCETSPTGLGSLHEKDGRTDEEIDGKDGAVHEPIAARAEENSASRTTEPCSHSTDNAILVFSTDQPNDIVESRFFDTGPPAPDDGCQQV